MTKFHLETPEDILRYLRDTPFASTQVRRLSGGYTNQVFRLHLHTPYQGRPTLVLKHARSFPVGELFLDANRQAFEVKAMAFVQKWQAEDAIVRVPTVHYYDEAAHVIIMDDCGQSLIPLKQYVQENALSVDLARDIGSELGKFIASLHAHRDEEMRSTLENYIVGRDVYASVTHGLVRSTLQSKSALPALSSGAPFVPQEDIEHASAAADDMARAIRAPGQQTITHGDYWTGNILVDVQDGRLCSLHVVDWELAKPGLAGADIGQMCAELYHLARFCPNREEPMRATVSAMWASYAATVGGVDEQIRTQALRHAGAHWVAWTPRILPAWGEEEEIRAVMVEGVSLLSGQSNDHWLQRLLLLDV